MNCAELETLLCDYVDGIVARARKAEIERHLADCAACAEMARAAAVVTSLSERAERVEPPQELVTRILFDLAANREKAAQKRRGPLAMLGNLLGPALQPRFAMGMAMTILSLAMLARAARIDVRQLSMSDLDPVRIWQGIDNRTHRAWTRAVKFYESLRFVYEIRSRLSELTARDEDTSETALPSAQSGAEGEPAGKKQ
ncbi:MAG TPA: zf-HC2 domain-containing protein [Bryobacteraceae bacterium]|nr:zf-HC2 domain-containing protein [Bryobacteraceae bacterium]